MIRFFDPVRAALASAPLRRLQAAWAASSLGTCAYIIALAVIAFRSGGATAVGLIMLARMAASAAAATPLGVLADRFSRRRVMALSDLVRALLTLLMAGVVESDGPILAVYVLAVLISVAATPFRPAQAALMPALADTPDQLTASNALAATVESTSIFLGPGIGGILLAVAGPTSVLVACIGAFLVSALLVWSLVEPAPTAAAATDDTAEPSAAGMAEGIRVLARVPALLAVTATYAAQAFVAGALTVFTVVLAIDELGLGNAGVGYLDCAFGVGGVVGGLAAVGLAGSRRLAAAFAAGVLAWGVGVALLGATTVTAVALVLLAGVGLGNTVVDVAAVTLLQRSAPDEVLGRVFGVLETVLLSALGLGSLAAPGLIALFGVRPSLAIVGLGLPVIVAACARMLIQLDRPDPETARRTALLRAHRIFAPLAEPTLEQLARALEPRTVAAGTAVVRQGEPGDEVFVVAAGELAVTVDGRAGQPLGRGEVFGEIALLRDVPRTATVTAVTDCELYTLGRNEFLAAVTGHARSAEETEVVIGARLGALRPGILKA